MRLTLTVSTLSAAVALMASVAFAQAEEELSAEELESRFEQQLTRGIVLLPTEEDTAGETDDGTAVLANGDYQAVPEDSQINLAIRFDFDSAALRDDQKPRLANLCAAMQAVDVEVFQIIGHTDASGTAEYNQSLSQLRAEEVKRYLVGECGIEETRLRAIGMGESAPLDPSDPSADANRRVEFQALS